MLISFMTQWILFTRPEHLQLIPQFQPLVINLLLPTIQKIKIPAHPTLSMIQNHWITLLLENTASMKRTHGSDVIALTSMFFMNLYIDLISLKILSKNVQKILDLIFP